MKLEKAIEIASDPTWRDLTLHDPDFEQALRLLISGGKIIQWKRANPSYVLPRLLPEETEE
ncbi:hypothetical protein ES705_44912 [subsurface metagenome]